MNNMVKRVLIVLASVLLLVYVGVQGYLIFAASLDTIAAENVVAYDTLKTTGVICRDEAVIQQKTNGYLFYTVENGNRVSKNGTIANVFPTEYDALKQKEWDLLNEEIESLKFINAQGTSNRANLTGINQQIKETWLLLSKATNAAVYEDINTLHVKLLTLLNKKQLTIGKEENFNARLQQLENQKKALESTFTRSVSTVSSPVAGYFVGNTDGFEGSLKTDTIAKVTVADVENILTQNPTPQTEHCIGKVVGNYEWYLTCVLPLDRIATLKKDVQVEVCLPFVQSEPLSMRVVAVNKSADDRAAVVFQCTYMSAALSTVRREQIEIRLNKYEGLYVPDEAIQFDENNQAGVYIQAGNTIRFRKIHVLYHNDEEKHSVCEKKSDSGYLRLYDKIVIQGENLYDGKLIR